MTRSRNALAAIVLAGFALAGAMLQRPPADAVVLNRGFLAGLATLPVGRPLTDAETELYSSLYWAHEAEFQYLVRTHDAGAERVAVRILANHSVPGGCCCDFGRFPGAMFQWGIGPAFWPAVEELPPEQRAQVLLAMDRVDYSEDQAEVPWRSERDQFLARDPRTSADYRAILGAPEAGPPETGAQ